ncbi:Zinc finger protein 585B-like Protein [Tribolium castaneum]|uniref:Zinc finger protein 585B-like Protein n=1 Tax=Tribolium castaneum TaxID=7070 RepID=D6WKP9_TRICA|nr:PREDICTED: zinc finger protein 2 homolog isoform X1 [Tribolium castaneum]EFA02994.1 Zinc finger protein 585B-like Protein [Tribolium castaneum]|eukprot:XP_008200457.1 PREDICTED: zinc finger protein 2 homolog isoform X1 [Tribolium castaneum]
MEIKLLSCPLCLKPHFQGVESLRSSLISAATSHLTCPVCNESLLGLDKLTIHLFTHISESVSKNEESVMEKSEKEINESINSLNESLVESDSERIKCDICNFTFTDKTILDMHQKLLHQTPPDKNTGLYSYHCHLCSKKFKKRGSLMVHLRVAHYGFGHQNPQDMTMEVATSSPTAEQVKIQDNKQWECDVCSKMFTTKYFLKKHKRLHTGEMPYFCAQCNKYFTFQQSYHKHMLYHSSEKPYVCNECGRAFKELSTLQNHARIHSGERPFGCETCGKRFRQRVSYLVHQRIHTGVMPYKCTACDKSFRYKVSQRSHKCPANPPGSVVKIPEPDKNQKEPNVKCIMSVDYNTGNINFIQDNHPSEVKVMYLEPEKSESSPPVFVTEQPDLFSMVLSPLLPDVESLCLTNSQKIENKTESLDINEESLKELLYGADNK